MLTVQTASLPKNHFIFPSGNPKSLRFVNTITWPTKDLHAFSSFGWVFSEFFLLKSQLQVQSVFLKEERKFFFLFLWNTSSRAGVGFFNLKINVLCWVDIIQKKNLQHRWQHTLISSCKFGIKLQIPFIISKLAVTHSTQVCCITCLDKWQVSILPEMSIS